MKKDEFQNTKGIVSWWNEALCHLSQYPEFAEEIARFPSEGLVAGGDAVRGIFGAVVSQQISTKAAEKISQKLFAKCGDLYGVDLAGKILELSDEILREAGLSPAKTRAVKDLAGKILAGDLAPEKLPLMTDREVSDELCKVKGVGPWTAHMVLIFVLGRPDVLPLGDYGIKKGILRVFGNCADIGKITQMCKPWSSAAAWLLWRGN